MIRVPEKKCSSVLSDSKYKYKGVHQELDMGVKLNVKLLHTVYITIVERGV